MPCESCGETPCVCPKMTNVKALGGVTPNTVAIIRRPAVKAVPAAPARTLHIVQARTGQSQTQFQTPLARMGQETAAPATAGVHRLSGEEIKAIESEAKQRHRELASALLPLLTDANLPEGKRKALVGAMQPLMGCVMAAQAMGCSKAEISDELLDLMEKAKALTKKLRESE